MKVHSVNCTRLYKNKKTEQIKKPNKSCGSKSHNLKSGDRDEHTKLEPLCRTLGILRGR